MKIKSILNKIFFIIIKWKPQDANHPNVLDVPNVLVKIDVLAKILNPKEKVEALVKDKQNGKHGWVF